MLIFSKASLFLWAEAFVTTCYTQNISLIPKRYNKTPYELLYDRKPDLSYLHVFGVLCYPTNDSENLGKLKPKANIGIFVGYAPTKKAFQIYNKRTRLIIETIRVDFDKLIAVASEQINSRPGPKLMAPRPISSGLVQNIPSSTSPNGKLIDNSIINGPYVRRMIPEPGDPNHEVPVNETFHVQTDDELTEKELKQIKDDDQSI
nr:retrovirus-related Pol polyprotein from transposon TNT 1-94 [Tanacetum cinerariifolium]